MNYCRRWWSICMVACGWPAHFKLSGTIIGFGWWNTPWPIRAVCWPVIWPLIGPAAWKLHGVWSSMILRLRPWMRKPGCLIISKLKQTQDASTSSLIMSKAFQSRRIQRVTRPTISNLESWDSVRKLSLSWWCWYSRVDNHHESIATIILFMITFAQQPSS